MGKKYNIPLQELSSNHNSHEIIVPLHINCPSNPKYDREVPLQVTYGSDTYLYDVLSQVERYISGTLHEESHIEFVLSAISWKSFTNKDLVFDDEYKSKKWLKSQMQYESIVNYKEEDIVRKGVHIEIKRKEKTCGTKSLQTKAAVNVCKTLDERLKKLCETSDVAYCNFDDIMYNFRKKESVLYSQIDCNYIENKQSSLTWKMRAVLLDWVYDLHIDLRLNEETLFAAIHYVDLFLSKVAISRSNLQLLGVTSIMIASKTYEIIPQPISEWIYLSYDQYARRQMISLEKKILKLIDWNVFQVTPYIFISPWAEILEIPKNSKQKFLIDFLIQTVSLNKFYLETKLSKLVAAVFYLSFIYLNNVKSMALLSEISHYNITESKSINNLIIVRINESVMNLVKKKENDGMTSAIFRKFTNRKYISKVYSAIVDIRTFQFNRIFIQHQNKKKIKV